MRRTYLASAVAGGLAVAAGLFFTSHSARSGNNPVEPTRSPAAQLPIAQVVLFSSGVGYFQREGEVQGNARVDLSFPVQDINDLLKSMVLQDHGGGHVAAVNYDSQAPVEKTLRSFAINLTNNPTFGQILNQARGEKVEAILQQTQNAQPGTLTGVIMGVEKKKEPAGKEVVEAEFLNLWCAEGMRSVKMSDVQRVRFLNPVMDSEVKKALEVLALSHDTQKKAVSLNFTGDGKRAGQGRLRRREPDLEDELSAGPRQEGQAVLARLGRGREHAGRRLEQRPHGPGQRPADLLPDGPVPAAVRHRGRWSSRNCSPRCGRRLTKVRWSKCDKEAMRPWPVSADCRGTRSECRRKGREARVAARCSGYSVCRPDAEHNARRRTASIPARSVSSSAVATKLGDFFQYLIEKPVSLPRQKSAMLPIVNQDVEGTKVSIYNQGVHAKFPLLGLRFKNSTPLHLMQGPITVFEGQTYAGDARILDLQPKEERLLSYAIDLGTEVEPVVKNPAERITKIKLNKGILLADRSGPPGEDLQPQEPLRAGPHRPDRAPVPPRFRPGRAEEAERAVAGCLSLPGRTCRPARRPSRK